MSGLEDVTACGPCGPPLNHVEDLRRKVEAEARREQADVIVAELRDLWQRALEREGNLASAVADVVWKATQYGETEDGDTFAYIVPKGAMHRLVGVAQQNGAHVPVSFRAPTVEPSGTPVSDKPASEGRSEGCPQCGNTVPGSHSVVCPLLEEPPRCAFPSDDDPGGFR